MTEDPWRYELQSKVDRLRSDHESAYRELKGYRESTDRRFDRQEDEMRSMIPIPSQIKTLTDSLDRLTTKLEMVVASGGAGRRADWQMAISILALVAMVVFSIARGVH